MTSGHVTYNPFMSTTPVPTTDIEILGTQLDVSVGIARSLVASWLPPPKPGEEEEEDEKIDKAVASYMEGRPARYDCRLGNKMHGTLA